MKLTHNSVSYVKSAFRIVAGSFLLAADYTGHLYFIGLSGLMFVLAEVLGIIEEIV